MYQHMWKVDGAFVCCVCVFNHDEFVEGPDLDGDMSEYGIASSGPSSTPSLAVDGGYPCDEDLFTSRVGLLLC